MPDLVLSSSQLIALQSLLLSQGSDLSEDLRPLLVSFPTQLPHIPQFPRSRDRLIPRPSLPKKTCEAGTQVELDLVVSAAAASGFKPLSPVSTPPGPFFHRQDLPSVSSPMWDTSSFGSPMSSSPMSGSPMSDSPPHDSPMGELQTGASPTPEPPITDAAWAEEWDDVWEGGWDGELEGPEQLDDELAGDLDRDVEEMLLALLEGSSQRPMDTLASPSLASSSE
ncbi:hypothetical protein EV360DRAFT_72241, partial [Lentinula raphanica]